MNVIKRSFIYEDRLSVWFGRFASLLFMVLFFNIYALGRRIKTIVCTNILNYSKSVSKTAASFIETNTFKVMFFTFTFCTTGNVSDLKRIKLNGIGKLAAVCVFGLSGFIFWIG